MAKGPEFAVPVPQAFLDRLVTDLTEVAQSAEGSVRLPEVDPAEWFAKSEGGIFAPRPKLDNEKPQGVTVDYDQLLNAWKAGKVMPDGIKG